MDILIFIVVLAILIFVHELGHFTAAKLFGIRVDSFAIGFPPTLWKYKYGETTYKLNLIPFGGYVKIFGETPNEETELKSDSPRSMLNKPAWKQTIVLLAGIIMNFIFAWILISIGLGIGVARPLSDVPAGATVTDQSIVVLDVIPDSPAVDAGLMVGDKVLANEQYIDAEAFRNYTNQEDIEIDIVVERTTENGTEMIPLTITPEYNSDLDKAVIGIYAEDIGIVSINPGAAIWQGLKDTGRMTANVATAFGLLIRDSFIGDAEIQTLTGPVGLVGVVGDAQRLGIVYLLTLTALISINLAVLNLIPFPALDGGRVLFLLIEKIKGSPIRPVVQNTLNTIGFVLLIILMIAVTVSDIIKIV